MATMNSPIKMAIRYGGSALAHAIYWLLFLQVAFAIGNVDLVDADGIASAAALTTGAWILAGIVILAALTLAARRLASAKG